MERNLFKRMYEAVSASTEKGDPIWYAGYLWIRLTDAQLLKILDASDLIVKEEGKYILPSGITIFNKEVRG